MRAAHFSRVIAAALTCAVWAELAHADAPAGVAESPQRFGIGGAYLFGLASGLAIFAVRRGIAARKRHLAEFGNS
jgi:hypothetical protein